ncbi:HAD family hydrolase [Paenibacillus thermotolerans]|uniref:HAD family hydrolase n=1 Tax=Paenibacillus thermotolerans TaxID=3027807 RepID=UPI00236849B5|nr:MULTISPECIES: HAD family hydrolase [unclassified Paenibacillus]
MMKRNHEKTSGISVIAFDLNETLVGWREAFDESFKAAVGDWLGRWSEDEKAELVAEALKRYHRQRIQWAKKKRASPAALSSQRSVWIKEAIKDFPLPQSETAAESLIRQILRSQPSYARISDETAKALSALAKSYRLAIISDTNRDTALRITAASGLKRFFPESRIFTPAAGGRRKPHASRFAAVARALKTPPSRCAMVGDSWRRDVSGAVKAGWHAVWMKPGAKKPASRRIVSGKPVIQIGSIAELPNVLR